MSTVEPQPTSWKDLLALMKEAESALNGINIDEMDTPAKLRREELTRSALMIERQLAVAGFDPLSQVENIQPVDMAQLNVCVAQLKTQIIAGQTSGFTFHKILDGIIGTVKTVVLPSLGLGNIGSMI
jgi:hypothetical protein